MIEYLEKVPDSRTARRRSESRIFSILDRDNIVYKNEKLSLLFPQRTLSEANIRSKHLFRGRLRNTKINWTELKPKPFFLLL